MSIKLKGSTSGSIELDVPAAVSGGDVSLTLPNGVGSANQTLKNGSTAGTLEFVTHRGFITYAIIHDKKTGTDGGTFTSGAWQTRDLSTTPVADPDSIVSVSSNQFTLGAGSYLIEASAPAFDCNRHQLRVYNATTSAVVEYGQNTTCSATYSGHTHAFVSARTTITGDTAFEIQHRCQTTKADTGMGLDNDFGGDNIYTVVKIFKEA